MSGIPIHMQDPITAVDVKAEKSPNAFVPALNGSTQAHPQGHAARPGAVAPAPTKTISSDDSQPPLPQPGAVPQPLPPTTTTKASLPPPPKPGERLQHPGFYAPQQAQALPPPHAYTSPNPPAMAIPPASTTSSDAQPSCQPIAAAATLPAHSSSIQSGLDHPPGYVQNPHASDMTPEQRFAVRREEHGEQAGISTDLGYTPNRSRSGSTSANIAIDEVKKWASEIGGQLNEKGGQLAEQLGELHGKIWETVQGKK